MKTVIISLIPIFILLSSCINEKSRDDFKYSTKICNDLTIEAYNVFGQGAFGADLYGKWLTDSLTFRMFIGTCDHQNTYLFVQCIDDNVIITTQGENRRELNRKAFKLEELQSQDNYEK